jgi:hypothetical protein
LKTDFTLHKHFADTIIITALRPIFPEINGTFT